jgi:hypothetical protein
VPAEPNELRRILAIELGAVVLSGVSEDRVHTAVTARCGTNTIDLSVIDLATKRVVRRSVSIIEGASTSTARLLALVMAELVFVSWNELSITAPEGHRIAPTYTTEHLLPALEVTSPEIRPRPNNPWIPARLVALGSWRKILTQGDSMWGGGLLLAQDRFSWIGWSVDTLYEHGASGVRFATNPVDLRVLTVGGALLAHISMGPVTLRAGVGLRAGMVQMQARGPVESQPLTSSKTEYATWGWPLAQSSMTVKLLGPLIAEVRGEIGYVVLPVSAMSAHRFDLHIPGWWASTQFGLGIEL